MCAVALEAFEQHAGQYGREQLRSRLALVGVMEQCVPAARTHGMPPAVRLN